MKFTVAGIDGHTRTRTILRVEAFDAQDAEVQAANCNPAILVAGVFPDHIDNVDTQRSATPQLRIAA